MTTPDNALIAVEMHKLRETKNMVLYVSSLDEEISRRSNIPNIYIRKTALAAAFSDFPEKIRITIEVR